MTWLALGNQVQALGDMNRRVYRIALHPDGADPHNRSGDTFRYPDLRSWTLENRPRLVTAALTLCRAWFAAGQPSQASTFGSFEQWQRMVGGILR